jgi:hypothetical protein
MSRLSRREFVRLTATGAAASPFMVGAAAPTAQEIVDRIKARLGVAWQTTTTREWESSEYARDMVTSGRDRGLILIGRTLSEDPGMKVCAQWLERIVPETPVRWMPAGDPFWRPTA